MSRGTADEVGGIVVVEMSRQGLARVLTMKDAEAAMTVNMRAQMANCDDTGCATEIAAALNTDQVVVGSLGHLGSTWILTLARVRVRGAAVLNRVSENIPADKPDALLTVVPRLVQQLFSAQVTTLPAPVAAAPVAANPEAFAMKDVAKNVGLLAGVVLPGVLGASLLLVVMTAAWPVAAAGALLAGALPLIFTNYINNSPPPAERQRLQQQLQLFSVAAAFYPGVWNLLAVGVATVATAGIILVPQAAVSVVRKTGRLHPARPRWLLASAVGLALVAPGLLLTGVGWLLSAGLLSVFLAVQGGLVDANGTSINESSFNIYWIGLGGLLLNALALIPAALGLLVGGVATVAAAWPVFEQDVVEPLNAAS